MLTRLRPVLSLLTLFAVGPIFATNQATDAVNQAAVDGKNTVAEMNQVPALTQTLVLSVAQQAGLFSVVDAQLVNAEFTEFEQDLSALGDEPASEFLLVRIFNQQGAALAQHRLTALLENPTEPSQQRFKLRLPWPSNAYAVQISTSAATSAASSGGLPDDSVVLQPFFAARASILDTLDTQKVAPPKQPQATQEPVNDTQK
ncbi:MAG: hypothetical protein HWE13_07790 [Gammaproteobacteria bacterium]|nr:hypothetical protein [Gammaproteobacteria bacterium]